jgi:hypothetical protein
MRKLQRSNGSASLSMPESDRYRRYPVALTWIETAIPPGQSVRTRCLRRMSTARALELIDVFVRSGRKACGSTWFDILKIYNGSWCLAARVTGHTV